MPAYGIESTARWKLFLKGKVGANVETFQAPLGFTVLPLKGKLLSYLKWWPCSLDLLFLSLTDCYYQNSSKHNLFSLCLKAFASWRHSTPLTNIPTLLSLCHLNWNRTQYHLLKLGSPSDSPLLSASPKGPAHLDLEPPSTYTDFSPHYLFKFGFP